MSKILIVDDEVGIRELLSEILIDEGYDVLLAENAAAARKVRANTRPDLILLDIWMPDTDGISLLKEWSSSGQLNMPVVMMSGHGTIDTAVEATRIGAIDYLEKPIALQKLLATVKNALNRSATSPKQHQLTLAAFARSVPLRDLKKRLDQIRMKSRHLLLRTPAAGIAELVARTLQQPGKTWVDLLEDDAEVDVNFLKAHQGALFYVSELSRLSRGRQRQLAFVLDRLDRYDLTVVAVTEHGQDSLLRDGWDDLVLARLFEVALTAPLLSELRDDIPEIATQTLTYLVESGEVPLCRLSTAAINVLRNQPWNGGFTELKGVLKSLALAALEDEISHEDAIRQLMSSQSIANDLPMDMPLRVAREAFERMYFEYHLRLEGSNMTRLAEKTGLERTHLYRKLKQLGISTSRRSEE